MRQFDVVANPNEATRRYAPYLIVLQSHHLDPLDTIFLAPLVNDARRVLSALDVAVEFAGLPLAIATAEAAGVPRASIGPALGSLKAHEDEVRRAFDRLMTGF